MKNVISIAILLGCLLPNCGFCQNDIPPGLIQVSAGQHPNTFSVTIAHGDNLIKMVGVGEMSELACTYIDSKYCLVVYSNQGEHYLIGSQKEEGGWVQDYMATSLIGIRPSSYSKEIVSLKFIDGETLFVEYRYTGVLVPKDEQRLIEIGQVSETGQGSIYSLIRICKDGLHWHPFYRRLTLQKINNAQFESKRPKY